VKLVWTVWGPDGDVVNRISACRTHAVNIDGDSKVLKNQLMAARRFRPYPFSLQLRRCRIAHTPWLCWTRSSTGLRLYDWNPSNWLLTLTATFPKAGRALAYRTDISLNFLNEPPPWIVFTKSFNITRHWTRYVLQRARICPVGMVHTPNCWNSISS